MNFHQATLPIIDLLMEPDGAFVCIYFFDIPCRPPETSWNDVKVTTTAIGQLLPILVLSFIFTTFLFVHRVIDPVQDFSKYGSPVR